MRVAPGGGITLQPAKTVDIFVDVFDPMAKCIAQMQNRAMTATDKV
jgi:hypothetical protein